MFRLKKFEVWASEIAGYLNKPLIGEDFKITSIHSIKIGKAMKECDQNRQVKEENILLIAVAPLPQFKYSGFIQSENPELDLAYVLKEFFATSPINQIHPTAVVSEDAQLGRNVMVGAHSLIGAEVSIGENSKILNNVVINGPVSIGKFCVIKDGAVIGSEGWGFIQDEDGIPFHPPQLGQILIEDKVWIGTNSTIERAMIEETAIGQDVKIDDLVHIGGGSRIGQKSEITAGVVVSSNVHIGKNVRIAPNAVIRENLRIEDNVFIGQGAVVIEDLSTGNVYVGNPAKFLRKRTD